jgi:hypothetical protein
MERIFVVRRVYYHGHVHLVAIIKRPFYNAFLAQQGEREQISVAQYFIRYIKLYVCFFFANFYGTALFVAVQHAPDPNVVARRIMFTGVEFIVDKDSCHFITYFKCLKLYNKIMKLKPFIKKFYTWDVMSGRYRLIKKAEGSSSFEFYKALKSGRILPSDIVAYITLVNSLRPKGVRPSPSTSGRPRLDMQSNDRGAYDRSAQLDFLIKPGDSKITMLEKNIRRLCNVLHIPIHLCTAMSGFTTIADDRIEELRPIGIVLGVLLSSRGDEYEEEDETGETKDREDDDDQPGFVGLPFGTRVDDDDDDEDMSSTDEELGAELDELFSGLV